MSWAKNRNRNIQSFGDCERCKLLNCLNLEWLSPDRVCADGRQSSAGDRRSPLRHEPDSGRQEARHFACIRVQAYEGRAERPRSPSVRRKHAGVRNRGGGCPVIGEELMDDLMSDEQPLLQIGFGNPDHFFNGIALVRLVVLPSFDQMETDMALQDFGHQGVN